MDIQQQNMLEPILEESEQEDDIEGSKTGEGEEEEDIKTPVGVETKQVMVADESEEDEEDAALLTVLRPRRRSRSLSQTRLPQMQSTNNHQEEMENFSVSDRSSRAVDVSDEATPPKQAELGDKKRSNSDELRIKISKIRWQKYTPVQKKTTRKRRKRSPVEEPFPEWLVDLMVNIEEATTHRLVVE